MGIAIGSSAVSVGLLALMILLLVITAIYHIMLNRAIAELTDDIADDH